MMPRAHFYQHACMPTPAPQAARAPMRTPALSLLLHVVGATALALVLACGERSPTAPGHGSASMVVIVSAPSARSSASANLIGPGNATADAVAPMLVYVSLPPGSEPGGLTAIVRNTSTREALTVDMVNAGFDPVPIGASVGDEITVQVNGTAGVLTLLGTRVPRRRPPTVVRTDPPNGKKDVPLNTRIGIVFSEPMDSTTISTSTVQLDRGRGPVPGTVLLDDPTGLTATFTTAALLDPSADYRLIITQSVRSRTGEALAAPVLVKFTTDSATVSRVDDVPFVAVSAGQAHTCALTSTGTAYCWGYDAYGQLGDGRSCPNLSDSASTGACDQHTPVPVAGGHSFKSIAAGDWTSCAVTTDGAGYCWGSDDWGSLGTATSHVCTGSRPECPFAVAPAAVAGSPSFQSIAPGDADACALADGGAVYCWGRSAPAALASGSFGPTRLGTGPKLIALSGGNGDSQWCGISAQLVAYCWTEADGSDLAAVVSPDSGAAISVDANANHSCVIATSGTLFCWGYNGYGQLGLLRPGDCVPSEEGYQFIECGPKSLPTSPLYSSVTVGRNHTCALTREGYAYCWGANWEGQFGDGTRSSTWMPTAVAGGLRFLSLSAGVDHTCGITVGHALYCWGSNTRGQLGDGTTLDRHVPVRIAGPR